MSLVHFYLEDQVLADEVGADFPLRLSAEDARHFKVLRLKVGEHIAVLDAARDYFECEITDAAWDSPRARICTHVRADEVSHGPRILLVQGLAKSDKVDTVVRGGTEIGVDAFAIVQFARSTVDAADMRKQGRIGRWESIAKSAAMQSGRMDIPEVTLLDTIGDLESFLRGSTAVLVFWEEAPSDSRISDAVWKALEADFCPVADARIAVIVGPEGGLERAEVERLLGMSRHGFAVTLGNSILRTETAGVVAPALVLYELRRGR